MPETQPAHLLPLEVALEGLPSRDYLVADLLGSVVVVEHLGEAGHVGHRQLGEVFLGLEGSHRGLVLQDATRVDEDLPRFLRADWRKHFFSLATRDYSLDRLHHFIVIIFIMPERIFCFVVVLFILLLGVLVQ